ncbi:hypothetical protein [Nonlabens agnitus]|uniref:Uncharacterized protein n=1 Tax=Nonlabens agnitus TaxID=870484 RepID=A0A2S9WRH6_9FLAO|nr:hypothetical protein [Nonlabens agnitus]PRP66083.1 hypothetical protein BST86_02765 [Nonlabens agnitus]
METNFEIIENYAVRLNGVHIDLHNNFDFKEILEFDDTVHIVFVKSDGEWVSKNEFKKLIFSHLHISFKKILKGSSSEFLEDQNTLSEITFFPKALRETNDAFMDHAKPNENDDIIYFFENGTIFRLNCEQIELLVEDC